MMNPTRPNITTGQARPTIKWLWVFVTLALPMLLITTSGCHRKNLVVTGVLISAEPEDKSDDSPDAKIRLKFKNGMECVVANSGGHPMYIGSRVRVEYNLCGRHELQEIEVIEEGYPRDYDDNERRKWEAKSEK